MIQLDAAGQAPLGEKAQLRYGELVKLWAVGDRIVLVRAV
jgi:hypothetical protein